MEEFFAKLEEIIKRIFEAIAGIFEIFNKDDEQPAE